MKRIIDIPDEYYKAIKQISESKCTADMLIIKNSKSLSDGFYNILRGCFNNMTSDCDDAEDDDAESEDKE